MKTITKYFGLITILMLLSALLKAQPQSGDCYSENNSYRTAKKGWIVASQYTPFDAGQIQRFKSLNYYPIDCEYIVNATIEVKESEENIGTTSEKDIRLLKYGTISFKYNDKDYRMTVYQDKFNNMKEFDKSPGTYFIPFKDETNGDPDPEIGTWRDGRYLIIEIPAEGNRLKLDLNQAINPFDAYRGTFTTLLISAGNTIEAPVPVGERKYEDRTE